MDTAWRVVLINISATNFLGLCTDCVRSFLWVGLKSGGISCKTRLMGEAPIYIPGILTR